MLGAFLDDFGSWEGSGRVLEGSWAGLGRPWGRLGRPRSIFIDFGTILRPKMEPKWFPNRMIYGMGC